MLEPCWYQLLITSLTGILAASLRFLRIPSLCFPISARATTFHICLITVACILLQSTTEITTSLKKKKKAKVKVATLKKVN